MDGYIIDEITGEIIKKSTDFFTEETLKNENFQKLNNVAIQMKAWINALDGLEIKYESNKSVAKHYLDNAARDEILTPELKILKYRKVEQLIKDNQTHNERLVVLLREGYRLIHSFREIFTGQTIGYSILTNFNDKKNNKIIEMQLSLEELLEVTNKIKASEGGNSFSLYINQADLKRAQIQKLGISKEFDEHQYKLFYSIIQVWNNPPKVRGYKDIGVVNKGRAYEVYMKYKNTFSLPLKIRDKSRIYWSIVSAKSENIPGWLQGDYEDKQLKTVFDTSTANLISMESAKKLIEETLKVLTTSRTDVSKIKKLIKLYTTKGINKAARKDIDKNIRNEADKYIKETFLNVIKK